MDGVLAVPSKGSGYSSKLVCTGCSLTDSHPLTDNRRGQTRDTNIRRRRVPLAWFYLSISEDSSIVCTDEIKKSSIGATPTGDDGKHAGG